MTYIDIEPILEDILNAQKTAKELKLKLPTALEAWIEEQEKRYISELIYVYIKIGAEQK